MGHNPSRNPFKQVRQAPAVPVPDNAYVTRSPWRAFLELDASVRSHYFNADQLAWLKRYGARLDRLASLAAEPRNDREKHFVGVCLGHHAPATDRDRLWLLVRVVCRYEKAAGRALRTDAAERLASELAAANRTLKAKADHLEAYVVQLSSELRHASTPAPRSICNVRYATWRFRCPEVVGPPAMRRVIRVKQSAYAA